MMILNWVPGTKSINWVNSNIRMSFPEKLCPKVFQFQKPRVLMDIS